MIYAFDTYYFDDKARTACVAFQNWEDKEPFQIYIKYHTDIEDYKSGEFFKRELPCILDALKDIPLTENDTIIVDGYVVLNNDYKYGLGAYLYEALDKRIPVIGVAKNLYKEANQYRLALVRGDSGKPLYITSLGIDIHEAYDNIRKMDGLYRMPTLLKRLDQLSRGIE